MNRFLLICLIACFSAGCKTLASEKPLFPFYKEGMIGYINSEGKEVIKARFENGLDFSEGLASVRQNGLFGYIDQTGDFAIKPSFDHAASFTNGFAIVYNKGVKQLINRKGKTVLAGGFSTTDFLNSRLALIRSISGKQGLFDLISLRLIADTAYNQISYTDGRFVLYKFDRETNPNSSYGIIDSNGKTLVPVGRYSSIQSLGDGHATAVYKLPGEERSIHAVIDLEGKELFRFDEQMTYITERFNDGLSKISLYKKEFDKDGNETRRGYYEGFINLKGQIVLNDPNCRRAVDFGCGRGFVMDSSGRYAMVNTRFQKLTPAIFTNVESGFSPQGYAVVATEEGHGIIDSTGRFIFPPGKQRLQETQIFDRFVFFYDDGLYGCATLNGQQIIKPVLQTFNHTGFEYGLLKAVVDERLTYFNDQGKIVWQAAKTDKSSRAYLNIDYMNRGYFTACSSPGGEESGGWAVSSNIPKTISGKESFDIGKLVFSIDTAGREVSEDRFFGYKVFIANSTKDTIKFDAQDSRLYIKAQAMNNSGEWQDIEYIPGSWCGNSYHEISLQPNAYWQLTMPVYKGSFATQIRLQLDIVSEKRDSPAKTIYSNVISGSVNPGQFCYQKIYVLKGIMDSYFD